MDEGFWVFGYGSLMWRPGFEFVERRKAIMYGVHRRLCIYSHVHRGTPEQPGLVLGLDKGGGLAWGSGIGLRLTNARIQLPICASASRIWHSP